MYGVNKVFLVGTVGRDPRITEFQNGGKVAQFSLATTKKGYTRKDGTKVEDQTEWHELVMRDGLASLAKDYIRKGTNMSVEGELRTRKYQDKNSGQDKYVTEIVVLDVHLLPSGQKKTEQQPQPAPEPQPQPEPQPLPPIQMSKEEEDLPF